MCRGARGTLGVLWAVFLLSGGCLSLDRRPSLESKRGPTFGETVKLEDLKAKYDSQMEPRFSAGNGSEGSRFGKGVYRSSHFDFDGVKRSEQEMSAALSLIEADIVNLANTAGVEMQGPVRYTIENEVLHQFEFDYRHHGLNGVVRGQLKKSEKEGGWNLRCTVEERSREREPRE